MAQDDQDQGFTHLPGTGGDFIDSQDVEGHRAPRQLTGDDGATRRDDDGATRRDDDVEGHRIRRDADEVDGVARRSSGDDLGRNPRIPSADGDDVEGHRLRLPFADDGGPDELYTSRPAGQGEIIMRGPNDNPHGER